MKLTQLLRKILALTTILPLVAPVCVHAQNTQAPVSGPGEPVTEGATEVPAPEQTPQTEPEIGPAEPGPGPVSSSVGASMGAPLAGTSQLGGSLAVGLPFVAEDRPLLRWGKISLRSRVSYTVTYGAGLQSSPGQKSDTWVHELSPSAYIALGDRWNLVYTPTLRWYSDPRFSDAVDHRVALEGGASYQEWNFGLSQSFARTSDPLIETGGETDQDTYGTSLTAGRSLNSKLSIDLGVSQNLRFIENQANNGRRLSDSRSWSTMNWLDYQYLEPLSFGLGVGATYDDVEVGADMVSEQVRGRLRWHPAQKLALSASAGVDIRQMLDSNADNMVSPTFGLGATHHLFEATSLFLRATRSINPSFYSSTVTETTGISAGANQRLLRRFSLNVSGSYTLRDRSGTSDTGGSVDDQESYSFNASLGTGFMRRGSISIFYQRSWNTSDSKDYDFSPETIGAQISYSL